MIEYIVGILLFVIPVSVIVLWAYAYDEIIFVFTILVVIVCPILALLNIFPWFNLAILFVTMLVCLGISLGGYE